MKKLFVFLLIVVCLISGCAFNVQVVTPESVEPTARTIIALPNVTALPEVTGIPEFPLHTTAPLFHEAYTSAEPSGDVSQIRFPAGSKQLYAIWSYRNMRAGLTIKREWYLNGELWLEREEAWDFVKYGESGIMKDVSIYDFDAGLPSGEYKLVVSIDDVAQPIGKRIIEGTAEAYLEFEILPVIEAISPNGQLTATSLVERLVLTDASGTQSDLFVGREIVSVLWLDNQHLLFVDRDRSGQVSNLLVGVRDELWIVDVLSLEVHALYKSETALGLRVGLYPSSNGKYIAGIEGSGYGDACFLDVKVIFFEMAEDYKSAKPYKQDQFTGMPVPTDRTVYPTIAGEWQSNTQYNVYQNETCVTDRTLSGFYLFDIPNLTVTFQPIDARPLMAGDLGWGEIQGVVTDAVTGNPIAGALVTCEHSSYTSTHPDICTGAVETSVSGGYVFQRIFFHDTDTIKLTVSAPGYQTQEFTQNSFTINDLEVNISLTRLP